MFTAIPTWRPYHRWQAQPALLSSRLTAGKAPVQEQASLVQALEKLQCGDTSSELCPLAFPQFHASS